MQEKEKEKAKKNNLIFMILLNQLDWVHMVELDFVRIRKQGLFM